LSGLGAEADVSAGNGEDKIDQHAAIQRQFLDRFRLDHFADSSIPCVQDVTGCVDVNALLNRPNFERNIHR
jgi:hypothetical protein